ncbi:MAG: alanine racemase [Lachnospiraceae bacterium]|nr:alanine racemase [Lachnospiraceae bacterium]
MEIHNDSNICSRGYVEVNLDAIADNMEKMKDHLKTDTKMIAVVKTDGYGHGSVPISKALESKDFMFGFAVATAEEAFELRKEGISKPIIILGYTFPYCYKELITKDIRPTVFKKDMADEISKLAFELKQTVKVHIKVDTGMSRIGIRPDDEGLEFVKYVSELPGIKVEGMFTHFAKADESDKEATYEQLRKFNSFYDRIEKELKLNIPVRHCSNSAGIIDIPEANLDCVRAGITMYGLHPSDEVDINKFKLTPALSLFSKIVYIKEIPAGTPISYGGTFVSDKKMRVATVPVGYGDGYPRSLSNKGYVLIRGKKSPILGRVCMDQMMVDVTDIPEACEYDKVTLIGRDKDEEITADFLGELSGRFNYELVCDISNRLPRAYVKDGKISEIVYKN